MRTRRSRNGGWVARAAARGQLPLTAAERRFEAKDRLRVLYMHGREPNGIAIRVALGSGVPISEVCEITGLSVDEVEGIRDNG